MAEYYVRLKNVKTLVRLPDGNPKNRREKRLRAANKRVRLLDGNPKNIKGKEVNNLDGQFKEKKILQFFAGPTWLTSFPFVLLGFPSGSLNLFLPDLNLFSPYVIEISIRKSEPFFWRPLTFFPLRLFVFLMQQWHQQNKLSHFKCPIYAMGL